MRGSSLRNLAMFQELIGDEFYHNVTLATTCWSLVSQQVGIERETELTTNSKFWKMMISKGMQLKRIPENATQAQDLVYRIASHSAIALKTQRDMVDRGISFSDLAVTKVVNYELDKLKRAQATLRYQYAEELARHKREMLEQAAELQRQRARIQQALDRRDYCRNKRPFGVCDNRNCSSKVKRWAVIWRESCRC